jgi:hydrogenase-4 component E
LVAVDLHDTHLEIKYFAAAISSILIGLIYIIVNRNAIIHLISFLVIENGIFLLALAVGSEMPMIVNAAILMDIFSSVLMIGVFLNRVGQFFSNMETDYLTELKD